MNRGKQVHEAQCLQLDNAKVKEQLNWFPKLNIEEALKLVIDWMLAYDKGLNVRDICLKQIKSYVKKG